MSQNGGEREELNEFPPPGLINENEGQGHLLKFNDQLIDYGYKRKFIVLKNDVLYVYSNFEKYYKNTKNFEECLQVCRVLTNWGNDCDTNETNGTNAQAQDGKFRFRVTNNVHSYRLAAEDEKSALEWVKSLERGGSQVQDMTEAAYGKLVPMLFFPDFPSEKVLHKMQHQDHEAIKYVTTTLIASIVAAGVEMLPGGQILTKTAGAIMKVSPSILHYYRHEKELKGQLNQIQFLTDGKILRNALTTLKAEVSVLERKYSMLRNLLVPRINLPAHVSPMLESCQRLLEIFCDEDHVFWSNPLIISPYVVHFSALFFCVAQISVAIMPYYKRPLLKDIKKLIGCLENYKMRGIEIRIAAVQKGTAHPKNSGIDETKLKVNKSGLGPAPKLLAKDKIIDLLYPKDQEEGTDFEYDFANKNVYQNYVNKLRKIYKEYFNKIIQELECADPEFSKAIETKEAVESLIDKQMTVTNLINID